MSAAATIPVTIEPEAMAVAAALGLQAEMERMIERMRQTIPGVRRIVVRFAPAYDTGEEEILIEAIRDKASWSPDNRVWWEFTDWVIATYFPDVYGHFTAFDRCENGNPSSASMTAAMESRHRRQSQELAPRFR